MRSISFAILAVTMGSLVSRAVADEEIGLCCLCEECYLPASGHGSTFIDESGLKSDMLLLEMADTDNESSAESSVCQSLQNSFRRTCCDSTYQPPEVAQAPTAPAPQINLSRGNQPQCDLCEDGAFPGLPRTVTAVLYINGNPTCELLYYMGLYGLIEDRLCKPMQDYLEEGCGCGIYDPDYTTSPPLPSPTKAPASSPTSDPTVHPTYRPTLRPNHLPTSAPSKFHPTPSKSTVPPTMAPELASSPTPERTVHPTTEKPTLRPSHLPTSAPSTFQPTPSRPSVTPTMAPVLASSPTLQHTVHPTHKPTLRPTHAPTGAPTPSKLTVPPTMAPVLEVTNGPPKGTTVPS